MPSSNKLLWNAIRVDLEILVLYTQVCVFSCIVSPQAASGQTRRLSTQTIFIKHIIIITVRDDPPLGPWSDQGGPMGIDWTILGARET